MATLLERATHVMPGGVSSPVRSLSAVNGTPFFTSKANGPYLWDTAGKQYIDMCMSFGPMILGHAQPEVVTAIQQAAANGTSYGTSTEAEVLLAEKIVQAHPAADWVRFVNSGTEAVMSAVRLARGYTKRNLIIKFSGCYHGHTDAMLVKAGSGLATFGLSSSLGVPEGVSKDTIVLRLGDIDLVHEAFKKHADNIAAVIIEGVPANNGLLIQTKEYMHQLQQVCNANGSLLILDEVITGFRLGWGGATALYGIRPDIVTFGKVIGGGLPVGAYGGRADLMEMVAPLGPVYQAGTLSGNPLAMAAGLATLDIIERDDVYRTLDNLGNRFETRLTEAYDDISVPLSIRRMGSIVWLIFDADAQPINPDEITEKAINRYEHAYALSTTAGIYLPPSAFEVAFLSTAHATVLDDLVDRFVKIGKGFE